MIEHCLKKELLTRVKSLEILKQKTQSILCTKKNRFSAVYHKHQQAQSLTFYQDSQYSQKQLFQQDQNIKKLQQKLNSMKQTLKETEMKQNVNSEMRDNIRQQQLAFYETLKEQQNAQLTEIKDKKIKKIKEQGDILFQQCMALFDQRMKLIQQIDDLQNQIARLDQESKKKQMQKYKRPASSTSTSKIENPKVDQKKSKFKLKQVHKYLVKRRSDILKIQSRPCLKTNSQISKINQRISYYQKKLEKAKEQKIQNEIKRNKIQQSIKTAKKILMNQQDEEKIQFYKKTIQIDLRYLDNFSMEELENKIQYAKQKLNQFKLSKNHIIIEDLVSYNLERPYDPQTFYKANLCKSQKTAYY